MTTPPDGRAGHGRAGHGRASMLLLGLLAGTYGFLAFGTVRNSAEAVGWEAPRFLAGVLLVAGPPAACGLAVFFCSGRLRGLRRAAIPLAVCPLLGSAVAEAWQLQDESRFRAEFRAANPGRDERSTSSDYTAPAAWVHGHGRPRAWPFHSGQLVWRPGVGLTAQD